ncbi:phage tail protein, partial [Buttiauxella gaviniae]|uniref:phage tail-collar fiber domain-containing protein n=1 Tax=Buttiauxella gaviniae TaxID=82990 RepID=UPI001AE0A717
MSQTVITTAFEALKAQQAAANIPVVLDEFVFANVPNLNITDAIDPAEAMPTAGQIVHRAGVGKTGVVNANAVVYSITLGADVGDFDFNWVGLRDKTSNTLAMIIHAPLQQKVKNNAGTQGNVLTRSFLMEYGGAKKETQITTPAGTWQIDFTARLAGMDERHRVENIDVYGSGAFIGEGFLVKRSGNNYSVTAGAGYVGGVRAELTADEALTVTTKPVKVWVDTSFTGTLTSVWQVSTVVTLADTLADYVKNDVNHYVFAVAQINADGSVIDLRKIGSNTDDLLAKHIAERNAHPQYAFKDSPQLTGKPEAPTASATTNDTQIATTAFVNAAISALVASSPEKLDTLNELAAALGNDANFAVTVMAMLAGKAPLDSPSLSGTPTVPNANQDEIDLRIANTSFVAQAIAELNGGAPSTLNTLKKLADALSFKASLASPTFSGAPMAPTPLAGTNTQQLATTEFVHAAVAALVNSSPAALDTLKELADALGNDANFSTTITTALAAKASLDSPSFTGTPAVPNANQDEIDLR